MTGRSDPARTGLPEAQAAFLAAVTPPGMVAVKDGYPWIGGPPEMPVPLLLAAWRNASQWRAARNGAAQAEISARLHALGRGPLAIITGSCGLDLLHCGWVEDRCGLVIALGPVMAERPCWPGVRLVTVIGRRDLLARTWSPLTSSPGLGPIDPANALNLLFHPLSHFNFTQLNTT